MPSPLPGPLSGPTRRAAFLTVAAGLVAAGCAGNRTGRPAAPTLSPEQVRDAALRRATVDEELRLIASYDATTARYRALSPVLAVPRAHHVAHVRQLGGRVPAPVPSPSPAATAVPGSARLAVLALQRAELTAARSRRDACLGASASLAPLLASIGGAEAVHATLLQRSAR